MTLIFVSLVREGGVEMEMEMEGGGIETMAAIGGEQWDTNMADIPPTEEEC